MWKNTPKDSVGNSKKILSKLGELPYKFSILQGFPGFIKQGKENVLQNNEKKKGNPRDKSA